VQTPAEKRLIERLTRIIGDVHAKSGIRPRILNIGAGKRLVIEDALSRSGCVFTCDRVDREDCRVDHPMVGTCWQCSMEAMTPVDSQRYAAAFANYVLEHIDDHRSAASEVFRVISGEGAFLAAVPNPTAPEFALARRTPLWFHRKVRGAESWETLYRYRSIEGLANTFESAGFETREISYYAFTQNYLARYAAARAVTGLYDRLISKLRSERLMGNVYIEFVKPAPVTDR
jgi:predicted SAM-dependent methyltransferase